MLLLASDCVPHRVKCLCFFHSCWFGFSVRRSTHRCNRMTVVSTHVPQHALIGGRRNELILLTERQMRMQFDICHSMAAQFAIQIKFPMRNSDADNLSSSGIRSSCRLHLMKIPNAPRRRGNCNRRDAKLQKIKKINIMKWRRCRR